MQLVGNRELVGDKVLELPSLPASELASFQNYAGLRGRTRTGRHTLHFTECESRLPAVLFLPITSCSGVAGLAP